MLKRIISSILAEAVLFSASAFAAFEDVADLSDEMQTAINTMVEKRYINGTSETEFSPFKMITRAELAAVMLRMLNKMDNSLECNFSDVDQYDWYYYVAASSAANGLITGFDDNTFKGSENITKEQLVAILARTIQSRVNTAVPDIETDFSDEISPWVSDYVKIAKSEGLLTSRIDNKFDGSSYVSRGNAAVMIMRTYTKIEATLTDKSFVGENAVPPPRPEPTPEPKKGVVVLDAGHGRDSWSMSSDEKTAEGWVYNSSKGGWGEWRHWKSWTTWQDCYGSGCSERAPSGGSCWYPIGSGDRDIEPDINLSNVNYAKYYLEQKGYEVRLSRPTANDNPSMTKRLIYCYPNNDTSQTPDADVFVCVHSNAGGGRGSAYIALDGYYDQAGIDNSQYVWSGNTLGQYINDSSVENTSLSKYGSGRYDVLPELVLFCKSPITIAYLEVGFFDNSNDLYILRNESEQIGRSIAEGIDRYFNEYVK